MKAFGPYAVALALAFIPAKSFAESPDGAPWLPADASCAHRLAPADAGAVAMPGGFLLVHPRNEQLSSNYSGCKTMWIVDTDPEPRRWSTLWFQEGRLQRVVIWRRENSDLPDRVCDTSGAVLTGLAAAETCTGMQDNPLVALRLASWPRLCLETPDLPICGEEPD